MKFYIVYDEMDINQLYTIRDTIAPCHGGSLLKNIPELAGFDLLAILGPSYPKMTVSQTLTKLSDTLTAESVILQFGSFQAAMKKGTIMTWAQRTPENKRLELHEHYKLYELLQIAFSPSEYYFHIDPYAFKKWDKVHNRQVFLSAIDALIIDPEKVPQSSLAALGIKQLDPDCQNLKNIFKSMHPVSFQIGSEKKFTPTINMYDGKFITLSSQSRLYNATEPVTQGEKKKEDVHVQMAVYPDLFSLIRREWHILRAVEEKQDTYREIKNDIISLLRTIERTSKSYGALVRYEVARIIQDIDKATSAKIVAEKLYHLYQVYGKHNLHDRQHLQAALDMFTKRIAQLIGIARYVQLHTLALENQLEQQAYPLSMLHLQSQMQLSEQCQRVKERKLIFILENYFAHSTSYSQEPFATLDHQIKRFFWKPDDVLRKTPSQIILWINFVIGLQQRVLMAYQLEHAKKLWQISLEDCKSELAHFLDNTQSKNYPELYEQFFSERDRRLQSFLDCQDEKALPAHFDALTDLSQLKKDVHELTSLIATIRK